MSATPLVTHTSAALARATRGRNASKAVIKAARADLDEAVALSALSRAGLSRDQRERVALALLTDSVDAWVTRTLDAAPPVSAATRARIARLLAEGVES